MDAKKLKKYAPLMHFSYPERTWPDTRFSSAPDWCSVDLRDGNQALINPMTLDQKLELFQLLLELGFKEIEVGFPSAADVEFNFLRTLIDNNLIPDDVSIQVLCQAREHLISKTFEAIRGAKNVIFHLYNSTSIAQREMVFNKDKSEIKGMALQGIAWIKQYASDFQGSLQLQYSPESFSGTEPEYALEVCEAVLEAWGESTKPVILNLPATVEIYTPNVYADVIEWFCKALKKRNAVTISIHTHNDRGTGIAASELALLAGADRVEGTLFGNGERTGNVDLVTLALNLFTHGIDPRLALENIGKVADVYTRCTGMTIHPRHPYAGDLVFTAFSGSHQDAIKKGMTHYAERGGIWDVPYLTVDPVDLNRKYEEIIRINSQSGKGGVAYVMENEFGYQLPKHMHPEFAKVVQVLAETKEKELSANEILDAFNRAYIDLDEPLEFTHIRTASSDETGTACTLKFTFKNEAHEETAQGNGPIEASKNALQSCVGTFSINGYNEHALSRGANSEAIAYVELEQNGNRTFGVGIDPNITIASVKALFSGLNRLLRS